VSVYLKDLTERVLVTFAEGFVASVVITELSHKSMWLAALGAGIASVSSLVKGLIAQKIGLPDSASLSKEV
jgi:hypothetical protein